MIGEDGNERISIPDKFIRRRSILIDEAIERSNNVLLESQNLITKKQWSDPMGGAFTDLHILEMLAKGADSHLDVLNVIRPAYAVETEMAWDDPEAYGSDGFKRLKEHPLFKSFIPELVCEIEDYDMYEFTEFGPNLARYPERDVGNFSRSKNMHHVDSLFKDSPKLTPHTFAVFLQAVLDAAESVENQKINFLVLWNLYATKHEQTKQNATKKEILIDFLKTSNGTNAHLDGDDVIWISREHGLPNMMNITYIDGRSDFCESSSVEDYKNYLSTVLNSITHAKCASKFTRVSKLYSKPLVFKLQESQETQRRIGKKFNTNDIAKMVNTNNKKYIMTQKDAERFHRFRMALEDNEASIAKLKDTLESVDSDTVSGRKLHNSIARKQDRIRSIHDYMGKLFEKNQPKDLELNVIDHQSFENWHHATGEGVVPLVINGGAGMGKTIRLTQFALSYCTKLLRSHDSNDDPSNFACPLPVFLKAKRCSFSNISERLRQSNTSDADQILSPLVEMMVASNPGLLNHQTKDNLRETIGSWLSNQHLHRSGFVFFIDGLDECSSEEVASELVSWFTNLGTSQPSSIILSTRPSHYDIAAEILGEHGRVDMLADKEYYSKQELSHEIPMRLCDAWGLTRHSARTLAQVFSSYESILQHPLFVGWFCFLILEDEVKGLEEMDQDSAIARNNLISKIISIGIRSSLERREAEFSGSKDDPASDEFLRILRIFIAVAFHFDLARPELIYHHMKVYNLAGEISPSIRTSIEEHCGILFLTADNVEWTHRTIPELMYADFYFDHPEIHHWGPLKATSPVVSRLAQLTYENGDMNSYAEAMVRLSFVHDYHYFNELRMDAWIDCENEGRYLIGLDDANNIIPIRDGNQPHEIQLAELFIENLHTISCFPLYYDLLEPSRKRETVQKILTYSNDPFGRDLITPEDEINLVHIDDVRTELVMRTTKIADCFEYYRMILADFRCLPDSKLDLSHDVFSIHNKAQNPEQLFFINHISGWAKYMVLDGGHAMTWLRPWLVGKNSTTDKEFYNNERLELIKYITEEYVEAAYKALFGSDHWADLLNTVFEQTHQIEIDILVGSGEYVDVERRNLLNHYMAHYNLNDLVSVDSIHQSPANILDDYDTENLFVRGIVMMPFVAECLQYIEGNRGDDMAQLLEDWPDFSAFNIISNYSPRVAIKDEQS